MKKISLYERNWLNMSSYKLNNTYEIGSTKLFQRGLA